MVSLLLASRANVNQDDRTGSTPLTAAAVTCLCGGSSNSLEESNGLDR